MDTPAGLAERPAGGGQRIRFRPSVPLDDALLTALPEVTGVIQPAAMSVRGHRHRRTRSTRSPRRWPATRSWPSSCAWSRPAWRTRSSRSPATHDTGRPASPSRPTPDQPRSRRSPCPVTAIRRAPAVRRPVRRSCAAGAHRAAAVRSASAPGSSARLGLPLVLLVIFGSIPFRHASTAPARRSQPARRLRADPDRLRAGACSRSTCCRRCWPATGRRASCAACRPRRSGAGRVLAAQLLVNLAVVAASRWSCCSRWPGSRIGVPLPRQAGGFILAAGCSPPPRCSALGLFIAAVATDRAGGPGHRHDRCSSR